MKREKYIKLIFGLTSIVFGSLFIITSFLNAIIPIWPCLIILTGIFIIFPISESSSFKDSIIPSSILIFFGIYLLINAILDWEFIGTTWPIIILIIAISFYLFFIESKNKKMLKLANVLLISFSLIILINSLNPILTAIPFTFIGILFLLESFGITNITNKIFHID